MERRLASERVRQRREGTGGHGLLMHEGMRWRGLDPTCRGGKYASPALGNPRNPQHRQPPPGLSSRLQPLAFSAATLHHAGQPEKESEWKRDKENEKEKKKKRRKTERERKVYLVLLPINVSRTFASCVYIISHPDAFPCIFTAADIIVC